MATDFWAGSHNKRWIVDRATIARARALDRVYVHDQDYFDFLGIYFANAIMKLGRKLSLRQRVIATATVFFKRFYLKNAYCETDPFLVVAACCYVAAKAEECPVPIKVITSEARTLFSQDNYNVKSTTLFDHTRIAEMEFYLVDDLECDLTVFHPYRTLMALCKSDPSASSGGVVNAGSTGPDTETEEGEAAEEDSPGVGVGMDDGPQYWGTGEGQLELPEGGFQHAWFIINDTYRSNLCLLYPPHLIAIAALHLTVVFHPPSRSEITPHLSSSSSSSSSTVSISTLSARRSTRLSQTSSTSSVTSLGTNKNSSSDSILTFLSSMNVSLPLIATIMQEIISLWSLWDRYKEDAADAPGSGINNGNATPSIKSHRLGKASVPASVVPSSNHDEVVEDAVSGENRMGEEAFVTPAMLSNLLVKMRDARMTTLVQTGMNIGKATNKVLERAQAAGK
ncbi:hypothetical protein AX15_004435 [Amanita polypyramis BW_CC]|nr:hypothetical protein AX15_004435 [Amanita polypyramis BW_CC]